MDLYKRTPFAEGLPIVLKKGSRTLEIDQRGGSAILTFKDAFMEKVVILNSLDYYFLTNEMEWIKEAMGFKTREAHCDCFGFKRTPNPQQGPNPGQGPSSGEGSNGDNLQETECPVQ